MFDRLRKRLQEEGQSAGLSAVDLVEMPSPQRELLLAALRAARSLTLAEMAAALPDLPTDDLRRTVDELTQRGWLIRFGEGERVSYQINLGRRRGSERPFGLWSLIGERLDS